MNEQQAKRTYLRAEMRYRESIKSVEAFWAQHGNCGSPLLQQTLEREYRASQRALRAAGTRYSKLARQHGWSLPRRSSTR